MNAVTVSFFAFLGSFSSFLPYKGVKIGKGQWEGQQKGFSAGSGGLKCQSRALGKYLLWSGEGR